MASAQSIDPSAAVKELADLVSLQAKVVNRTWLATITVSLVVLLPRIADVGATTEAVELPFNLGSVSPFAF